MKKTLTVINNIVCAILLVATFATMLIPCWNFTRESKIKVRYCRYCGTAAELDENNKVKDGYVCPGTAEITLEDYETYKVEEEVETTEPAADATEATEATETTEPAADPNATVTVACTELRPRYQMVQEPIYSEDEVSVMEFVWMTFDNEDMTEQFIAEGIVINDIVLKPFLATLFAIAGVLFCLLNAKGTGHSIFPLGAGILIMTSYLTTPPFQTGSWMLTLGASIALTVVSLVLFAQFMTKLIKWFVVPCYKK